MGEIVNLRRVRKARARLEATTAADLNRVAFGRTKAEKDRARAEAEAAAAHLDGHRLDERPSPRAGDDAPEE